MEAQENTYREFCRTIFETLFHDIDDRRGIEHGSAQSDDRDTYFGQCVGIPLDESHGGEPGSLIRQMRRLGQEWLDSYEGFDDSGDDGALHNSI